MKRLNKFKESLKVTNQSEENSADEKALEIIKKYKAARIIWKEPDKKEKLISLFTSEEELEEYFDLIDRYDSKDIEKELGE